jgi:hypothetical protein
MDWSTKRQLGLYFYLLFVRENPYWGSFVEALNHAANLVEVDPRTIHSWVVEFEENDILGKNQKLS